MDSHPTLLGPTNAELVEAAQRADDGNRLAFPHLFDRCDPELLPIEGAPVTQVRPEPKEIDPELVARVLADVGETRQRFAAELKHLDKHAPRRLHISMLTAVAALDEVLDDCISQEWSTGVSR